ncbi:hypothetical protein A7318_08410 [Pseudomonas lurida]|nr:hypothetical protein A7318_08410 [Pseudomonas lurida]
MLPSLYLAMTDPKKKAARFALMQVHRTSELEAAISMAEQIDRARGIEPLPSEGLENSPCSIGWTSRT